MQLPPNLPPEILSHVDHIGEILDSIASESTGADTAHAHALLRSLIDMALENPGTQQQSKETKMTEPTNEQISLPANLISIIDEVVEDLSELKDALDDAASGQYAKAVKDLLHVVEHIVVDLILPKVKVEE